MIIVKSEAPDKYTFICDTNEEKDFIDLHQNELFDKFINIRTNGKIKSLEDLYDKATNLEFGVLSIEYFWYISKGLEWTSNTVGKFQDLVNKEYANILIRGGNQVDTLKANNDKTKATTL